MRKRIGKAVQTKVWLGGFGNLEGTAKADVFLYIVLRRRSYVKVQLARIAVRKQNHDPKGREFQYLMIFSEFEKYQIVFWVTVLFQKFKPRSSEKRRPRLWKSLQQRKVIESSIQTWTMTELNMDNDRIEELGFIEDSR